MEHSDLLLTIAEIAIAFAGFASLASVLGRQRSRDHVQFDAWRLRNVLEAALAVVLFAILPFIPDAFGVAEARTWRWMAGGFLLWNVIGTILSARRARALQRRGTVPDGRAYFSLFLALELAIDLPLLAVVLGLFPAAAAALYLVALVLSLVQAGLMFMRLLGSILTDALA